MQGDENFEALSDLLAAMLFVLIVTLIAYVLNFSSNQAVSSSLGQQLADIELRKSFLLNKLSDELTLNRVIHTVHLEDGAIAISAEQLGFGTGSHVVDPNLEGVVSRLATSLSTILGCTEEDENCLKGINGDLDRLYIEGHTDNVPFRQRGYVRDNLDLSLLRAASVTSLLSNHPNFQNTRASEIFIPAGFGDTQPIVSYPIPTSEPLNRRIQFTFVLHRPWIHQLQ